MTIGIDASRANASNRTGTEWYSFYVIQELKQIIPAEHKVVLYSKEPLRDGLEDLPENWESKVLNWPPKLLWTQLRLSLEMLTNKPDMLYVPAHTIPIIHPKKVVTVLHDVGFEREDELYNDSSIADASGVSKMAMNALVRVATLGKYSAREQDYHRFSARLALKAATTIVTVSEFSKKEMLDVYDLKGERVKVIPNGFNPRQYKKTDVLDRFSIGEDYIFYIGRLEEKKNTKRLVEAFHLLRETYGYTGKLVLAGSPGFGFEHIEQMIHKKGLHEHVVQTGWTSDEDVATLMQHAKVFVLPSLYEGFGIPVLEAMAAETPVACSAIPSLEEVCADAALFFNPKDEKDIAKTIHTILNDRAVESTLIENGTKRVQDFSWKETATRTWSVLQKVA